MSGFVRGPVPDRHGHTPIGVSVVQRTLSLRKVGSREEVRRARVYPGTQALLDMLVRAS